MRIAGASAVTQPPRFASVAGEEPSVPPGGVSGPKRSAPNGRELSAQEQREVQRLAKRDREVREHERAHQAAGGQYVRGGPHYETQRGPDGETYAVGGEVQIDTSPVPGNPTATIQKMQQVRRAALAPAQPSAADRRVASEASRKESAARQELRSGYGASGSASSRGGLGGPESAARNHRAAAAYHAAGGGFTTKASSSIVEMIA